MTMSAPFTISPKTRSLKAIAVTLCVLLFTAFGISAQELLPRSTPEEQGMHSADVRAFLDAVVMQPDGAECHGAIVVRHGHVIGEAYPTPFTAAMPQTLYSCSKTFTAVAVGLAVDRNLLKVTDRVGALLPDKLPAGVSDNLANMTVSDLLTMSSGITPDWEMRNSHRNWTSTWLAKPVGIPGERFAYDSMDTYLLSAIVQRVTGKTVLENLNEHIFGPLGITDAEWELSPEGITTGGWGLHVRPEVMAKFGQLLLDNGRYEGRQLVSEEWVRQMMTPHRRANAKENYGYQMWECEREGAWRADGAYGQYIVILPRQDMVVVLTQCSGRGAGKSLAPVWEHLCEKARPEPLAPSEDAILLQTRQKEYYMKPAAGSRTHRNGTQLQGRSFSLSANSLDWRDVSFDFRPEMLVLDITTTSGEKYTIACGNERWMTTWTKVCPPYSIKAVDRFRGIRREFAVAGSYGWLPDGTLTVHVMYPSWITGAYMTINPKIRTMTVKENYQNKPYTVHLNPIK